MFPEYRDLIPKLASENPRFSSLYHKHSELDKRIQDIAAGKADGTSSDIDLLKKEKLRLKDQLYAMLKTGA